MKQLNNLGLKRACIAVATSAAAFSSMVAQAQSQPTPTASLQLDSSHKTGGPVPDHFLGVSIEYPLVPYMLNPTALPYFTQLVRGMGSGTLRIGGGSQQMTYTPNANTSSSVINDAELTMIRNAMDSLNAGTPAGAVPNWGAVIGAAYDSTTAAPSKIQAFVQGVARTFAGSERYVAAISMGNEPDADGRSTANYIANMALVADPAISGNWPLLWPDTSEDTLPWQTLADQSHLSRWFWSWPQLLDAAAPIMKARAGVFGTWFTDHFYPIVRTCTPSTPWRCPSMDALLSKAHMDSLDYEVYIHTQMANARGLRFRMGETSTAAHQGAPGISDVAGSATYALDMYFHVACPQPPDQPGANMECLVSGSGVNMQNAARNGNSDPQDGPAYYNILNFDPNPATSSVSAAPIYYSALLFNHLAHGTNGLRPVSVNGQDAGSISAWRLEAGAGEHRLFMINKGAAPITVSVSGAAPQVLMDRMTPYDPTNSAKMLDATAVKVDGHSVNADGTFTGFSPISMNLIAGTANVTLAAGEAVVMSEVPQVHVQMVPAVQNLRSTAGVVTAVVTANTGDLSLWDVNNLRLQGAAPISVASSADKRSFVVTFNKSALQALATGSAVGVALSGNVTRDGIATPFNATTNIQVVR